MQNELGKTLESLRKGQKMSLRAVGEITGLNFGYVRDLELNINRSSKLPIKPTVDTLQKLAAAYNYPLEDLLEKAGYTEVAISFQKILSDPEISDKKKNIVQKLMALSDDDQELEDILKLLSDRQ